MNKPHKKKHQDFYSIFFSIPLYEIDIMAMVGCKNKEEVAYLFKKQRVNKDTTKRWMDNPNLPWLLKRTAGSLIHENELEIIYHFKTWKDDEKHLGYLVHEVSHMVDSISEYKNLEKETEAKAYLAEYIFNTMRKNLG